MNYWVSMNGQNYGPYPLEEIGNMLQSRTVLPSTLAAAEGSDQWVPLSSLIDIQPAPAPPPLAAPSPLIPVHYFGGTHPSLPVATPKSGFMPLIVIGSVFLVLALGLSLVVVPLLKRGQRQALIAQDINNMRQVKFALDGFSTDYEGQFPNLATHREVWDGEQTVSEPSTSNDYFRQLFGSGETNSEQIFWVRRATTCDENPPADDFSVSSRNKVDRIKAEKALEKGECGLAYTMNQSQKSEPERVRLLSAYKAGSSEFDPKLYDSGTSGTKVLVTKVDGSTEIAELDADDILRDEDGDDWLKDAKCWEGTPPVIVQPTQ